MPCPLLFYCVSELSPIPVLSPSQFYGFCACHSSRDLWSPRVLKNVWFLLAGALLPAGAGNGQKGALLLPEALLEAVLILTGRGQVPWAPLPVMSGMARYLGAADPQIKIIH